MKQISAISFLFFSSILVGQSKENLRIDLQNLVTSKDAVFGISIKGIEDQDTLSINGDLNAPMMSVFKFHIALATLNEVDNGKLKLDQKIHIKREELHPDTWSPIREEFPTGDIELTLDQLIRYTVSHSDNNGCDILIELVGGTDMIQKFIEKQGIKDFTIKVNEQQMRTWENLYLNTTTPLATTELLEKFFNGKVLSKESTKYLYQVMVETSRGSSWMKAGLPEGVELAHRTGISGTNESGLRVAMNNIGIVKLPDGKHFILSIYIKHLTETFENSEKLLADIAKLCWNYFVQKID